MVDGKCRVCPNNCDHSKHCNADFYFVTTFEKKKVTREELFKLYNVAKNEKEAV